MRVGFVHINLSGRSHGPCASGRSHACATLCSKLTLLIKRRKKRNKIEQKKCLFESPIRLWGYSKQWGMIALRMRALVQQLSPAASRLRPICPWPRRPSSWACRSLEGALWPFPSTVSASSLRKTSSAWARLPLVSLDRSSSARWRWSVRLLQRCSSARSHGSLRSAGVLVLLSSQSSRWAWSMLCAQCWSWPDQYDTTFRPNHRTNHRTRARSVSSWCAPLSIFSESSTEQSGVKSWHGCLLTSVREMWQAPCNRCSWQERRSNLLLGATIAKRCPRPVVVHLCRPSTTSDSTRGRKQRENRSRRPGTQMSTSRCRHPPLLVSKGSFWRCPAFWQLVRTIGTLSWHDRPCAPETHSSYAGWWPSLGRRNMDDQE